MAHTQSTLNWEHLEGMGQALTISQLIEKLQAIKTEHGDIAVEFRNYLEENMIAPLTDVAIDRGMVVCSSNDRVDEQE